MPPPGKPHKVGRWRRRLAGSADCAGVILPGVTSATPITAPIFGEPANAPPQRGGPDDALPRIAALDGLRGVAILMVLVGHLMHVPEQASPAFAAAAGLIRYLWVGVDLFFVLSGFLITGILLQTRQSPTYLRSFYARRVLRIFPLYYATLIVYYLVAPRLPYYAGPSLAFEQQHRAWYFLYAGNFVINRYHFGPDNLGHFWTLAVEEHFYLLWPLLVLLLGPRKLRWACVAAVVMSLGLRILLHLRGVYLPQLMTPCRTDALAMGALLAVEYREGRLARWLRPATYALVPLALLSAMFLWPIKLPAEPSPQDLLTLWASQSIAFTLLALTFAAMVVVAVCVPRRSLPERALASPVLRFFGKYSYAMYCFHPLLIPPMMAYLSPTRLTAAVRSPAVGLVIFIIAVIVATTTLAFASWHLFEKHLLRLKRFFPYAPSA
jgi:peptidoglycan/LPS O-acetylase OafA/YrhL